MSGRRWSTPATIARVAAVLVRRPLEAERNRRADRKPGRRSAPTRLVSRRDRRRLAASHHAAARAVRIWFLRDAYPLLGWPDAAWRADTALALPPSIVIALCVVRTVAAGLFLVGAWTRAAGLVAGTAGYVVMAQTPFGFIFTLHLLYQAAILLALTDSATSFALRPRAARSPATSLLVIRCWTAWIYASAGISGSGGLAGRARPRLISRRWSDPRQARRLLSRRRPRGRS